ncbi:MAG: hypothetical protein MK198_13825 [Gracilimonas sp.]|uniref:hypothetical protein n=1 Tax=Gracilimonas sp. TaxID=1974203 RepID=UPI0037537549|nr:hypothetical protein [Gracilimonas sp.]
MPYNITEDNWSEDFNWFLIDNGEILYAFKDKQSAEIYMKNMYIDYWLLTNLENITHETMLDPKEDRCWNEKIQTCIEWVEE